MNGNTTNDENFYGEIRDPLLGDIRLYRYEMEIINTITFQRLRGLCQLPGCEYVYPAMTHTRFSHCLGVLGMTDKIIRFSNLKLSNKDVRLLRIIALLHDIEEPPFFNAVLHEPIITPELIHKIREQKIKNIFEECRNKKVVIPVSSHDVLGVMSGKHKIYLKSIIDCEIGANRLDYLQRDSYFCGVKYGYVDDRIFSSFVIQNNKLLLKSEFIPIANNIFHNLLQMKISVYDHKVVRSYLTLIRDGFRQRYKNIRDVETIFEMTDDEFLQTLDSKIKSKIHRRKLPKLVYELNTLQLKNPEITNDLDNVMKKNISLLTKHIANKTQLNNEDILIEPIELKKIGDADPLYVRFKRKSWEETTTRSTQTYTLDELKNHSKNTQEWSLYFYNQWRVFIFCNVGENWDIKKIDRIRDLVSDECEKVFGFLKHGNHNETNFPDFNIINNKMNNSGRKQLHIKIFEQNNLSKEILKTLYIHGSSSTTFIQEKQNISRTSASLILNQLEKSNLVTKIRAGKSVKFEIVPIVKNILGEYIISTPIN